MSSIDSILSKEGKNFVRNVAESVGYSQSKIADIFKNEIVIILMQHNYFT